MDFQRLSITIKIHHRPTKMGFMSLQATGKYVQRQVSSSTIIDYSGQLQNHDQSIIWVDIRKKSIT